MGDFSNLELFLKKYLKTKNINWLNLFVYEYNCDLREHDAIQIKALVKNERYKVYSRQLPYHLFRLLFTTINELVSGGKIDKDDLQNFLTTGIGGKILMLLSDLDVDLSNVTNERELVDIFTQLFPTERWEKNTSDSKPLTSSKKFDIRNIFKIIPVSSITLISQKQHSDKVSRKNNHEIAMNTLYYFDDTNNEEHVGRDEEYEQYLEKEEYKTVNESFHLSSVEIADKILIFLNKLIQEESMVVLKQTQVIEKCLKFSIETLIKLHEQKSDSTTVDLEMEFSESDKSVINLKLLELMSRCFNSLINCDEMPIELEFKKLSNLLQISNDIELTCGLVICVLSTIAQCFIKKLPKKNEIMCELIQNKNTVLERIELLKTNAEYLFDTQRLLIKIICAIKKIPEQQCKKRESKRALDYLSHVHHHHYQLKEVCIFERLLINSLPFVKKFKHLSVIVNYLSINGVCCCNADIQTIHIFMRSSTISFQYLKFLENQMFKKLCNYCSQKLHSIEFQSEYFELLMNEIQRRQGYELHVLLHHLVKSHQVMTKEFRLKFVIAVIIPTFIREKITFLNDPENNQQAKLITNSCLQILCEFAKSDYKSKLKEIMTIELVNHLKDCTFVPFLASYACIVLRYGLTCGKNDIEENIKVILFENSHFLINEVLDIYDQIGLLNNALISENSNSNSISINDKIDSSGFEVLNERTVIVKESLSNLDILLITAIHLRILNDLIENDLFCKNDFVMSIRSNFNINTFFTIAYYSLNSIFLRKEKSCCLLSEFGSKSKNKPKITNFYERCDYLSPIIVGNYDINYDLILNRSYKLFEICQNFTDKLNGDENEKNIEKNSFTKIYTIKRDKRAFFKAATIHRDNFLTENIEEYMIRDNIELEKQNNLFLSSYHHLFNTFKSGISLLESKNIQETFKKIVSRFIRTDEELKAVYRTNTIKEITSNYGLKYLASITRNCFDICFRLFDNAKFNAKMSTALEKLKFLLLEDDWDENREAMIDTLQLLLNVAEMKVNSANQLMLTNLENHLAFEPNFALDAFQISNFERLQITFSESEDEDDGKSSEEDKKTEVYFTADENYDADEEYFSTQADDSDCSHSFCKNSSTKTIFNFKNTNDHISKLVVEVLMDISRKCLENKEQWNSNINMLTSLAKRLTRMKKSIGETEFLLKGFSPLFTTNDVDFGNLQRSILELISDLTTPESLRIFFSMLTCSNAPVELLISRMEAICHQHLTLTAFSGVNYPIYSSDATVISTCDTFIHRSIQSYRDIHLNHKIRTPFTEASQIIPLNFLDLKIWNSDGFTISTWIDMKIKSQDENNNSAIHIFSFGSDKVVLAVFLNKDGSLSFNIMKPNQNLEQGQGKIKINKLLIENQSSTAETSKSSKISNKENVNRTNIFGIASAILKDREVPNIRTRSSLRNITKKSNLKEDELYRRMDTSKVSMKSKKQKIKANKWTHICLSLKRVDSYLSVLLTLNGAEHENIDIPMDEMIDADANGMLQLLFVGAQKMKTEEISNSIDYIMSNILLFKTPLEAHLIAYLFALGPDCDNFVDCEVKQIIPLREYVNLNNLISRSLLKNGMFDNFHRLQSNLILSYSVGKTNYATAFMDKKSEHGKTLDIFSIGPIPKSISINSLQRAVFCLGGLSSLLFMFARTVELSEDPQTQSSALFIFLKTSFSNNYLYSEFEQKKMFNLVAHVFKHSNCYRGPGMLKAILDVVYGGSMFLNRSKNDNYQINERSDLNIQNPGLLMKLLTNFNIFHTDDSSEAEILDLLFKSLIVVVRDSHPFKNVNRQCLVDHGFFGKIIEFCKVHFGNTAKNIATISSSTALAIINLLKMLSKTPPTIWSLNEIQNLLLLLHHPSESFITHDRSKFCFTLSNQKPSKSKSNSIITSKYFNFSTKIRSTSTSASAPMSSSSPSSSQRSSITISNTPPKSPKHLTNIDGISSLFNESESKLSKNSAITSATLKYKTRKFDELTESQIVKMSNALKDIKCRKELKTPTKTQTKRLKSAPKGSPFRKTSTPFKRRRKNEEENDEFDEKLLEKFETLMSSSNLNISEDENSRNESGVCVLQEQLLLMLKDALNVIHGTRVQNNLPDCFKIESFIMFANHFDSDVRAAVIDLIHTITNYQSTDVLNSYNKSNYWMHLGNQLSILPINTNMLQATLDWICLEKISIDEIMRAQEVKLKFKPAFRILISMIPSMIHDVQLLKCSSKFLRLIIETQNDCFQLLNENGLITSCIKALIKISDETLIEPIQLIIEQIAMKSFTSAGSMNILWELLYGLTYAERQSKNEVVKEVHMTILRQLLSVCLIEERRRGSRGGQSLAIIKVLGNLPSSEIKTRFNLVHDRAIQYALSWENPDEMKNSEVDFIKYLIDLHFYGMQQGASLILWSVNPNCCEEIKLFCAQRIIATLIIESNFSMSEPKTLKSLLSLLINSNSSSFSEEQIKVLTKYCGSTANQKQQNWNWSISALERIENIRQNASKDQFQQVEKIIYKLEPLVQTCIDSAMRMTRNVIDIQNKERRKLINQMKKTQEIDFYREWYEIIMRMIHEGAPWYNENLYPSTFELDETEGPGRMRIRLKRTILRIEERFFLDEFKHKAKCQHNRQLLEYLLYPKETERYTIRDQIIFTFNGKHLTMEQEIEGEIIITDNQLIFLATHDSYTNSIICNISDIEEIWNRRYQHKELAMEIFLKCSKNFFIIFESKYERDIVNTFMADKVDSKNYQKIEIVTQKWIENKITNYDYLMELNKISGRSYNDLMQYPVFPWIIVHYDGSFLDLTSLETFRKLNKTISTQYENAEEHYVTNYRYLNDQLSDHQSVMKPYHYSSHYSNSGTVLHFLVRLPPFTNMFLLYQDHNFDIPDRTFHSMATTFRLTSKESATDVKELVPEFYYLPDFLVNNEGFNYGRKQSGEQVNDVKLPEWCENSSRLFVLIQRQALESDHVRRNLHHWIDLIFGFKQKGKAAIEAVNVFHPATYPEFQIANITDIVERSAYETMVRTYGQMPKQIFVSPHKKSMINEKPSEAPSLLKGVKGLKYGILTGSLQLPKPKKLTVKSPIMCKQKNSKLVLVRELNMFFLIPISSSLMKGCISNTYDLILWKEIDGIVRIKSLIEKRSRRIFSIPTSDPITCCGTDINYNHLWFGHLSGNISVYLRTDEKEPIKKGESIPKISNAASLEAILDIHVDESKKTLDARENRATKSIWHYPIILLRHQEEVVNIKICVDFKIAVSIACDGRTVIWDSQKIEYIRTIEASCNSLRSCLTHVDISPTLGDILTVFKPKKNEFNDEIEDECFEINEDNGDDFISVSVAMSGKSQLRLHNINGKYIGHVFSEGVITAVCFSYVKEGTGMNVIATAFNDGFVRLYSTWNLAIIREIATGCESLIKEISYSTNQYLVLLTDQEIHLWGSDGLPPERPNFHDIIFVS